MKFRIHYTLIDGQPDSIIIEADTIEEIQEKAAHEVRMRNGRDPWSEQLND